MELNKPWQSYRYCVVDLEGTGGQDKENEAILEIAAVHIVDGQVRKDYYHTLIHPRRKIPRKPWITLTNEDLKNAPPFEEIQKELFSYLNQSILVAHNAHVDWRLLKRKYPQFSPLLLDTLALSRKLYANEKKHSLDDLSDRLQLTQYIQKLFDESQRHRAHYDALTTAHAFITMCREKLSPETTLSQLYQLCGIETVAHEQGNLFS